MQTMAGAAILWVVLSSGLAVAGARVQAHKCMDAQGRIRYQQQACQPNERAELLQVEGEIDPQRKREAEARMAANAPAASPPVTAAPVAPAPPVAAAQAPPRVVCPPTQEKPGGAPARGTDPWAMAINRDWYARLPSRTALKNAGRWPKGCD